MKKKDEDLTRIEDLSEFLHDESDDENLDPFALPEESDFDLDNDATDPNIELPDEFLIAEDSLPEVPSSFEEETSFEDSSDFSSNETDFDAPAFDSLQTSDEPLTEENNEFAISDSDFDQEDDFSSDFSEQLPEGDNEKFEEDDDEAEAQREEPQEEDENELVQAEQNSLEDFNEEETLEADIIEEELPTTQKPEKSSHETYKAPENFKELRDFANTINYTNAQHEGNPPFSIVLSELQFKEDIEDILIILSEFGIISDSTSRSAYTESLKRGSALIPRLSEYAAIVLSHKLRRFNLHLKMGLTQQIAPPKSYNSDDKG